MGTEPAAKQPGGPEGCGYFICANGKMASATDKLRARYNPTSLERKNLLTDAEQQRFTAHGPQLPCPVGQLDQDLCMVSNPACKGRVCPSRQRLSRWGVQRQRQNEKCGYHTEG